MEEIEPNMGQLLWVLYFLLHSTLHTTLHSKYTLHRIWVQYKHLAVLNLTYFGVISISSQRGMTSILSMLFSHQYGCNTHAEAHLTLCDITQNALCCLSATMKLLRVLHFTHLPRAGCQGPPCRQRQVRGRIPFLRWRTWVVSSGHPEDCCHDDIFDRHH